MSESDIRERASRMSLGSSGLPAQGGLSSSAPIPGTRHHYLGKRARTAQMFRICRIEILFGGGKQKPSARRMFNTHFSCGHDKACAERGREIGDPRNVERIIAD